MEKWVGDMIFSYFSAHKLWQVLTKRHRSKIAAFRGHSPLWDTVSSLGRLVLRYLQCFHTRLAQSHLSWSSSAPSHGKNDLEAFRASP